MWPLTGFGSLVMKRVAGNGCVSTFLLVELCLLIGRSDPAGAPGRKGYFGLLNGGDEVCWVIFVTSDSGSPAF